TGLTCTDGIDNDCNGKIDAADPACKSANLAVTCAIPVDRAKPDKGGDCTSYHVAQYSVSGGQNPKVQAEFLGLDGEGNLLTVNNVPFRIPNILNGDSLHMTSRINPIDWKIITTKSKYEIYAPVPMLHVSASDGNNTVNAYCSNIPFLQVIKPNGDVVGAETNVIQVIVALPRVALSTLF